ncbi:hypothetical protein MKK67_23770 [Methylobacterium sp. J-072]|uniref:hypothetical protein n=1 Tax=Methylobacterium sp. J-072 TaxID=2836651 RepID=UPI001FBBACB6|nr:hypothetical protein [Methylobacterium sp. J-072]MCJ2095493.1 hypothetical protein [Methylobacterium sp. J-072]
MSLVNVFATSRRVVVLTDTSLYDATGRILGFEQKTFGISSWTGALTFRGNAWGICAGLELAERYGSFDEFMARSPSAFERDHKAALAGGLLSGQTLIEIHVAGWSEREDRARAFVLRSPGALGDEAPPYTWVEIEGAWHDDFDLMALSRLHRQGAEPEVDWTPETFEAITHGIPLAEEQRRKGAAAWTEFAGRHVIGGELWLTVVDRDGARLGVIYEWPDVAGEPIQPAPFDESLWPEAVPLGLPWSYAMFLDALKSGALDNETFEMNDEKMAALQRAYAPAVNMTRKQRRTAQTQARKVHAHAR